MVWSPQDRAAAQVDGWDMHEVEGMGRKWGPEITGLDGNNEAAIMFVQTQARTRDDANSLYSRALTMHFSGEWER